MLAAVAGRQHLLEPPRVVMASRLQMGLQLQPWRLIQVRHAQSVHCYQLHSLRAVDRDLPQLILDR